MLNASDLKRLGANQGFLAAELQNRGIAVSVYDWANELIEARLYDHQEFIFGIDSTIVPYSSSVIAGSKSLTKSLLTRAGLSVPKGGRFTSEEISQVILHAKKYLGFPVVVKPSVGVQGSDVHTGIENEEDLTAAIISIQENRGSCEILLEEYFEAKEYRLFITKEGKFAALHRDPAYVIGDGVSSIELLAKLESHHRLNPRINSLGAIVLDNEASRYLRKRGLSFQSIPKAGEKIQIRGSSNVMLGGVPEDVTEIVHPEFIKIGLRALKAINNLPYAGLDLMTADISKSPTKDNYRILEVNSVPGIGIHMAPGKGKARNVAGMIVDLIFPETVKEEGLARLAA